MLFDFQIDLRTAMPPIGETDGHPLGVALGLPHRALGAVAADLEDLEVGFGGVPFQLVGRLQLLQRRLGLLERQGVLLGLDLRRASRS